MFCGGDTLCKYLPSNIVLENVSKLSKLASMHGDDAK